MAHINRGLAPEVDTVFFMTGVEHGYVSSTLVREIAALGGDVSRWSPAGQVALRVAALSGCDNSADAGYAAAVASPGRAGPIDIIFLIERLETLIANGSRCP